MPAAKKFRNKQVVLKAYPTGYPDPERDFEVRETVVSAELAPETQSILLQNLYISLDPYLRGRMTEKGTPYAPAFKLGEPVKSAGVSRVVSSTIDGYKEGDYVAFLVGWENFTLIRDINEAGGIEKLRKVDPNKGVPLSYYMGVLGMPGMTAYVGLLKIGEPKEGDTVFVSAAMGAVGQIVGQLAKLKGCKAVGSAGSDKKVQLLKDTFRYDDAFNYKEETDLDAALKKHCPDGIDIYYENVGGKMLDAVLANINIFARIPVCGMISQYNLDKPEPIYNIIQVLGKRARMQGFIVGDWEAKVTPQFYEEMTQWLKEKKITYVEDIMGEGVEALPKAFIGMLRGENVGKAVVKVADPDEAPALIERLKIEE